MSFGRVAWVRLDLNGRLLLSSSKSIYLDLVGFRWVRKNFCSLCRFDWIWVGMFGIWVVLDEFGGEHYSL